MVAVPDLIASGAVIAPIVANADVPFPVKVGAAMTVSALGLIAIGIFISTITDVPVGAMATTIVLQLGCFLILAALAYGRFSTKDVLS